MIDLKLPKVSKKEAKKIATGVEADRPNYPWGTRLDFEQREVKKLKLENVNAGDKVTIKAIGKIIGTRVSESEEDKKQHNVEIQIQKISVSKRDDAKAAFNEAVKEEKKS